MYVCRQGKGKVHKLAFSALYFAKKVYNLLQSHKLFFFYLNTLAFQICKKAGPKERKGFVLAFDVWVSDPKSKFFGQFCQFSDIQTSGRI